MSESAASDADETSVLAASVFAEPARQAAAFAAGRPFRHGVLRPLLAGAAAAQARAEVLEHLPATFKETDLFKLHQTADFANLPADDALRPTLMRVRAALYAVRFRRHVERVSGCGPLSDRVDCAANVYMRGAHLLTHDDVIGTRRVSYIVYLSDAGAGGEWTAADGGALELYPLAAPGTPRASPSAALLPHCNSMAFFVVEPGVSFHSVQEVFAERKWRISIQGWYHAATPPPDTHLASIRQLTVRAAELADAHKDAFAPIDYARPGDGDDADDGADDDNDDGDDDEPFEPRDLSPADLEYLSTWINDTYLSESDIDAVADKIGEQGSVQLMNFLKPERAERLVALLKAADAAIGVREGRAVAYDAGVSDQWTLIGPPHMRRFLQLRDAADAGNGESLEGALRELRALLLSPAMARLLFALCGTPLAAARAQVRRFRPSLDYTVAHYGDVRAAERLLATLCLCDESVLVPINERQQQSVWRTGDVGGFECYMAAEEDGEAAAASAEVYRPNMNDDEGGLLSVSAASNSLNLVLAAPGIMHFVKYVSAAAPGSRWDVAAEYTYDDDEDDDEDDNDDNNNNNSESDAEAGDDEKAKEQQAAKRLKTSE